MNLKFNNQEAENLVKAQNQAELTISSTYSRKAKEIEQSMNHLSRMKSKNLIAMKFQFSRNLRKMTKNWKISLYKSVEPLINLKEQLKTLSHKLINKAKC